MNSSIVRLSIGGKKFETTTDTLTRLDPDSMLATMFSGRYDENLNQNGFIFIDRDGKHFRHILNWLRDGAAPELKHPSAYRELLREVEYFQLAGLMAEIKAKIDGSGSDFNQAGIIKLILSNDSCSSLRLGGVDLSGVDLSGLHLDANLSNANLKGANLKRTNLEDADLKGADLEGSNLDGANLQYAKLNGANLSGASLQDADLQFAALEGVNLSGASWSGANLAYAEMNGKDVSNNAVRRRLKSMGVMLM